MLDIRFSAREKIIDAKNVVSFRQQSFAQMRAEKTGSAGDQNPFHEGLVMKLASAYLKIDL
jgi:hypothetical protein